MQEGIKEATGIKIGKTFGVRYRNMPGMNRFETLARIGQLPACARVPVVLYSTGMDHVKVTRAWHWALPPVFRSRTALPPF